MRKYLFLAYPVGLYVIFSLPVLLLSVMLKAVFGTDPLMTHAIGAMGMALYHIKRKRKQMTNMPAVPWKRIFFLAGIMFVPVVTLTLGLTGKAFFKTVTGSFPVIVLGTFFWASLSEELLFREFLTCRMQKTGMSRYIILLLPALMFSLCHRPESASLFAQRFILGTGLGFLFLKTKDLALCTATHWIYNIVIYTFHYTFREVSLLYSPARAALNVLLCLLSLLGIVVAYSINKSKFAGYT
ncbi:MAG TPA: CPBP family intramembrane metalloprotease [Bacteroidales bacterium]|mgnify:CR=1 FL=1|nr:CPBP family intramembrane metalloprotease [Bacteroidales bacterium]